MVCKQGDTTGDLVSGKLVGGFGINDVDYVVSVKETIGTLPNGRRRQRVVWSCPYYIKWDRMISRCYNRGFHKKNPTYLGCSVCEEWKYLSKFIEWVDSQPDRDWEGKSLDKDLLVCGNKIYSPTTCVFVDASVNNFITDHGNRRGKYMIGVSFNKNSKNLPYIARCNDPFKRVPAHIGSYPTEQEAHDMWRLYKHKYALELAEVVEDTRIKHTLRTKYYGTSSKL